MQVDADVATIVLDKGVLALVLALATWLLTRSLERLKAREAWNSELARERVALARRLTITAQRVDLCHREARRALVGDEATKDDAIRTFNAAVADLEAESFQASVFMSDIVAQAFREVFEIAVANVWDKPSDEETSAATIRTLQDAISAAGDTLRKALAKGRFASARFR